MNINKDILILSSANPTRAYSGVKYLFHELKKRYKNVVIWAVVPKKQKNEYEKWGEGANSFLFNVIGDIPKIRLIFCKIFALFLIFKYRNKVIICHELSFYKLCVFLKKKFPNTIIIHYCTELFDENSPKHFLKQLKFYESHSDVADLVIECDEMRRIYRKEKYSITKPTVTIYNTLPEGELKKYLTKTKKENKIPVITYTGAAYGHRQLDLIIKAVKKIENPYVLKLFVYGPSHSIEELNSLCLNELGEEKYSIIVDTPREELFNMVVNSDIGIVYYNPTLSIGNRYASPTKFFEYIGMGIPIVSSNNDSLIRLIDQYNLGTYVENQSVDALYHNINQLLNDKRRREKISHDELIAFHDYLCYESQAMAAFDEIDKLFLKNGDSSFKI